MECNGDRHKGTVDSVDDNESVYGRWELSQRKLYDLRRAAAAGDVGAKERLERDGKAMQAEIDRLARVRSEIIDPDTPRYEE